MKILSIDAWRNEEGWEWDQWHYFGDISKEEFETLDTDQKILTWFFESGYTTTDDMELAYVEDDQYNKTVCDKSTGQPVFAIEYGPEY